jgi:adenylate kinase
MVIIIAGVPGVGKTTIACMLAERLGGVQVNLSELAEAEGLILSWDAERETAVADIDGLRVRLIRILSNPQKPIVVEGHFAVDVTPPQMTSFVIVLRRAPWILKKELESRGYNPEKVRENVEAELINISLAEVMEAHPPERVCEIDTTGRASRDVVEEILSIVEGETNCRHGQIDWLGYEETQRLLKEG